VSRPTRHDIAMGGAKLAATRSTCNRLAVGCVIAREGRPLSTGYNGPPKGRPHCKHKPSNNDPCTAAIHAERNAIIWAARCGVAIEGADLYVTHMPCLSCANDILQAGISTVRYIEPYRDRSGIDLLIDAGVTCTPYFERLD
jgi:dCMP deaminase